MERRVVIIMKKNRKFFKGLFILYAILNLVFAFQIIKIGLLPAKFLVVLFMVLILFLLIMILRVYRAKGKNRIAKFFLVILSIAMLFGNFYLYKGGSFLSGVTGLSVKKEVVSLIVKDESTYKDLEDLRELTFGIEDENEDIIVEALDYFEEKLNYNIPTKEYSSYERLAKALYNQEEEVIVVNEAYRNFIKDEYPDFDDETRVIAQFEKIITIDKPTIKVNENVFTVLISGIDVYGSITNNARSDVNILAVVDPTSKEIILISIPRDYYLPIACKNNNKDKLTHTGIWGVDCTMDTLSNLFEVDIDHYVRVNFSSLISVVDAIGGVNVYNDYPFSAGGYDFPVGDTYLDGAKALVFVRDRKNHPDGDSARGRNQTYVVEAIINKMASPALITNFSSILSSLTGTFQTNMSDTDISSLVRLQLNDPSSWNITNLQVKGTGGYDYSYALGGNYYMMYPDYNSVNEVIREIQNIGK